MSKPRVIAIVQARMGSSRLPGKVMADICGSPMLAHQVRRLKRAAALDEVVIATTSSERDAPLVALAERLGIGCFRGSETDVLDRYRGAAEAFSADVVVRITADCPLIDSDVIDAVVAALLEDEKTDYASNVIDRSYPQGLDVEALRRDVLERVASTATSQMAREHVTWHFLSEEPYAFHSRSVREHDDHSDLRWTVDTPADLELVRRIYIELELSKSDAGYREILEHVLQSDQLRDINSHVEQRHIHH